MDNDNIDVSLEELLKSSQSESEGASAQETEITNEPETPADDMSPRAQERIRELVEENNRLKAEREQQQTPSFQDLDSFINSVEDEPSKQLLKTFAELQERKIQTQYQPLLEQQKKAAFEQEFAVFESKAPILSKFKGEIEKQYLRDNKSIKTAVGETLVDIALNRLKPIEQTPSSVNRQAPDISNMNKDDLYSLLEQNKPL